MHYRRMPTSSGFCPSELLMSRQMWTRIVSLFSSPAHIAQGKQTKVTASPSESVSKLTRLHKVEDTVYALYCGPRQDKQPRWVPAIVKKALDTRCYNVKVVPHGPIRRRHREQLQPRYASSDNQEPGDPADVVKCEHSVEVLEEQRPCNPILPRTKPLVPEYGPDNPRSSKRMRKALERLCR